VPSTALRLAELFKEAGLADGVFNVVPGDKEAVDALLHHPDVRAISSVSSTPVAKYIYETAACEGKRVQALGGAKNHAVVMPDCDLDFTVDALIGAGYGSAGERCMAISAVVAVGGVADPLVSAIRDKAAALKVGPGNRADVDMGPLITREHRDKVRGYIDAGVEDADAHAGAGVGLSAGGLPGLGGVDELSGPDHVPLDGLHGDDADDSWEAGQPISVLPGGGHENSVEDGLSGADDGEFTLSNRVD